MYKKKIFILVQVLAKVILPTNSAHGGCSLYLADSTIENAGYGVFAAKEFERGEKIGLPGIGIPVTEASWVRKASEILAKYWWDSHEVGGYTEAKMVATVLPGIALNANFHEILKNGMFLHMFGGVFVWLVV